MTMAATNWTTTPTTGVDELLFQNDTVSLCLLVNRRHKTLRVIDFRAGPTVAKRNFVIAAAKREGVEPFGRDVVRSAHVLTGRGGFELYVSWESQACFGNSFLEILTGPRDDGERLFTIAAIRLLCDRLIAEGAVSTFSLAPADDVA